MKKMSPFILASQQQVLFPEIITVTFLWSLSRSNLFRDKHAPKCDFLSLPPTQVVSHSLCTLLCSWPFHLTLLYLKAHSLSKRCPTLSMATENLVEWTHEIHVSVPSDAQLEYFHFSPC